MMNTCGTAFGAQLSAQVGVTLLYDALSPHVSVFFLANWGGGRLTAQRCIGEAPASALGSIL
jgi:hypothetical protein